VPAPDAASKAGLLTEAETAALFEQLSPENLIIAESLLSGFERAQKFAESAEWSAERERARQRNLDAAKEIAEGDALDDVERLSLHIIGKLALNGFLPRSSVLCGGLDGLFDSINGAIREALPMLDARELECIQEAEREKQATA
jgi:hypothetical protein